MDQRKEQVNNLLEEGWFFGNTLKNRSKSSKVMVRCNSDPCTSSSTKEDTLEDHHNSSKMSKNTLLRAPSLPVSLGKDTKYEAEDEEDDDDYEPRMGDLIRQAMPMPMNTRRLDRTPSLPPCRGNNEALNIDLRVEDGCYDGGKSCRKVSVESSPLVQEKGPIPMVKLSRRASIDSSLLPPKCTSKGTKSASNSKNRTPKKLDQSKIQSEKTKLQKSSMDLQIEELQGFKDLSLSSKSNNVSPNVRQIHVGLQRRASLDSNHEEICQLRRPSLSEPRRKPSSPSSGPPSVAIWADQKSNQDMKAQIKFWARAVASNVRQEC